MSDPNLSLAVGEIKAILGRYDIAGIVAISSKDGTEFLQELSPSWSCSKIIGDELRFKAKREDYPSMEAQKEAVTSTTGMIMGFLNVADRLKEDLERVVEMLGKHFDICHVSHSTGATEVSIPQPQSMTVHDINEPLVDLIQCDECRAHVRMKHHKTCTHHL